MKNKKRIKLRGGDLVFTCVNSFLLTIAFIIVLYPLLFVISASFSEPQAVASGQMILLPVEPSLQAYKFILDYDEIWIGYANTIFYTFFGTLVNLILTIPCAYALSRRDCPLRTLIMTLFMITMYFGGGLIPGYLNMRDLGLLNTLWGLMLPNLVTTWNMLLMRNFIMGIPQDLMEAARIDGANEGRLVISIVLPLSLPIIATLSLFYGVGYWNSYSNVIIQNTRSDMQTTQVIIRRMYESAQIDMEETITPPLEAIRAATVMFSTVPILCVYPFLQKHFAQGLMVGGVKG